MKSIIFLVISLLFSSAIAEEDIMMICYTEKNEKIEVSFSAINFVGKEAFVFQTTDDGNIIAIPVHNCKREQ